MRLQKFLAHAGVCSRRRAETLIQAGRVAVNGQIVCALGSRVDPPTDRITVDGAAVVLKEALVYLALNKPAGYVTSCRHPGKRVVTELVDVPQRVYPVGRLDKASTGLLLLTNDGRIHHRLSHPSFDHEKEYVVAADGPLSDEDLEQMRSGIQILDGWTRPARVDRLGPERFRIVLKEGKNRQIRRMVGRLGRRVVSLERVRVANVHLGSLAPGSWRPLRPSEVQRLLARLDLR
jgi:23S rRNA pseudouridine2605 synthase/23S rRNA pseudouridine2604 synthase